MVGHRWSQLYRLDQLGLKASPLSHQWTPQSLDLVDRTGSFRLNLDRDQRMLSRTPLFHEVTQEQSRIVEVGGTESTFANLHRGVDESEDGDPMDRSSRPSRKHLASSNQVPFGRGRALLSSSRMLAVWGRAVCPKTSTRAAGVREDLASSNFCLDRRKLTDLFSYRLLFACPPPTNDDTLRYR